MRKVLLILIGAAFLITGVAMAGEKENAEPQTIKDQQAAATQAKDAESDTDKKAEKGDSENKQPSKRDDIKWNETRTGLKWVDLKVGEGTAAKNGDQVTVHYHVWLADKDGGKAKSVQSSRDPNPYTGKVAPFDCKVGDPRLVKGWNEGMVGMQPGGLRRLWVPSKLGWGPNAMGEDIPANSDVIFEIELLDVK